VKSILEAIHLSKSFPGVQAVDDVSFRLQRGEILALIGENGAGKSTLMQCLGGVQKPEEGRIHLEGHAVEFSSSYDALQLGISMVFQELSLVDGLTISENIFANRQPVGRFNNIHWQELRQQTRELLDRFNLDLDPSMQVKRLSMGQKQMLEVLKAISTKPKVLMLDEPTSSLTESETVELFINIRKLQQEGMSFIYITHKLNEVFQLVDRVMVLRDGKHVGTWAVDEVTDQDLVAAMVGREIKDMYGATSAPSTKEDCLRVEGLSRAGAFEDIGFRLHRGEILGFSGLVGAGRTEMARAIFGIDPKDGGKIWLEGYPAEIDHPQDAIMMGIAYLTEDRKVQGLFVDMAIRDNLIAPALKSFTNRFDLLNRNHIAESARERVHAFGIATPSITQEVFSLSGGNQQKCMIAMWMGIQPKIVIFDEPTRGVDVGARSEIYHKLRELAAGGTGVILISSDLPELIGMCDRIIVMHQGSITGEVSRADFSEELIMEYAAGIRNYQVMGGPA
jgi:ABC-type sugar transport system ATPase subunit